MCTIDIILAQMSRLSMYISFFFSLTFRMATHYIDFLTYLFIYTHEDDRSTITDERTE